MSIERRRARCDVGHRRGFLVASAALGTALLLPAGASAGQVRVLQGSVRVNGKKASKTTVIRPGDTVETAKGARVVFVVGEDAFLLRGESKLILEHTSGTSPVLVTGLRLLSGGLLAAFAPGPRRIETPIATAGIRGTAVYIEASAQQTYFCTCYGVVELRDRAGGEKKTVISGYHSANMIFANPAERGKIAEAEVKDHTDEELIMLERLVGRTSPILQRNQKLKEGSQPDAPESQAAPESKAAEEKKPALDQPASDSSKRSPQPAQVDAAPKDLPQGTPAESTNAAAKPSSKKTPSQKPGKAKAKPMPEAAPPQPAPVPEKSDMPGLGPAPTPPAAPQPPAPEYRLPPPRLDQ